MSKPATFLLLLLSLTTARVHKAAHADDTLKVHLPTRTIAVSESVAGEEQEQILDFTTADFYIISVSEEVVIYQTTSLESSVRVVTPGTLIVGNIVGKSGGDWQVPDDGSFSYVLQVREAGTCQLLLIPKIVDSRESITKITLSVTEAKKQTQPPTPVLDSLDESLVRYGQLWREAQAGLASRLDSGAIKTEAEAAEWFTEANKEALRQSFLPLIQKEVEVFRGDKWSASAHSDYLKRTYINASKDSDTPDE